MQPENEWDGQTLEDQKTTCNYISTSIISADALTAKSNLAIPENLG